MNNIYNEIQRSRIKRETCYNAISALKGKLHSLVKHLPYPNFYRDGEAISTGAVDSLITVDKSLSELYSVKTLNYLYNSPDKTPERLCKADGHGGYHK